MTRLTVSLLDQPLTAPVLDGSAWLGEPDIVVNQARSVDANTWAMRELRFDVAEMSFATYLRARLVDDVPVVALPVFTGRRFTQPLMGVREDSEIGSAAELTGRRVAVPQYWMTSSVWHRAVLAAFYGVEPSSMTWIVTGRERFRLKPDGVRIELVTDGRTPADLVRDGFADAVLGPRPPAGLRPLFDDVVAEQIRYHRATAVLPIMHLVVLRGELVDRRPGEVDALWRAFVAARRLARPGPPVPGVPDPAAAHLFSSDPWAYGVDANAASLQALLTAVHAQGLLPRAPDPADIFVPAGVLSQDA